MSARETAERLCRQALYPSIHEDDARHPNERLVEAVAQSLQEAESRARREALEGAAGELAYQLTKRLVVDMPTARASVDAAIRNLKAKE